MSELVLPVMGSLNVMEAIAACQSVFPDPRIAWHCINQNAGAQTMDLMGIVVDSKNKVIVKINARSVVAYYLDALGRTLLESRTLLQIVPACIDLKSLISTDNRVFAN